MLGEGVRRGTRFDGRPAFSRRRAVRARVDRGRAGPDSVGNRLAAPERAHHAERRRPRRSRPAARPGSRGARALACDQSGAIIRFRVIITWHSESMMVRSFGRTTEATAAAAAMPRRALVVAL